MAWHQQKLNSWADFVAFVERLNLNEQGDAGWFIRGQSNQAWQLQPSLLRGLGQVTVERALGIEFGATRRFQAQYHLFSSTDGVDRSQWGIFAWWMVMQHFSCPTRLLDWTLSPYVALYFAVEQFPENDGALWLFPSSALETLTTNRYGKLSEELIESHEIQAVYPVEATQHSNRSASQQAVFTICTHVLADHGDVIAEIFSEQEKRYALNKIIIPAQLKNEFLSRLRTMNVTPESLFPNLDGLGRTVRDYIRLRAWRTHS